MPTSSPGNDGMRRRKNAAAFFMGICAELRRWLIGKSISFCAVALRGGIIFGAGCAAGEVEKFVPRYRPPVRSSLDYRTCRMRIFAEFLIAYSRMVLGVHYLSDTLVGIALGVLFAVIGLLIHRHLAKMRLKRKIQQRHIK